MQKIIICEEYGYRWWLWEFQESVTELQKYWDDQVYPAIIAQRYLFAIKALKGHITKLQPINCFIEPEGWLLPDGNVIKVNKDTHECHIHESDDSWLNIQEEDNE